MRQAAQRQARHLSLIAAAVLSLASGAIKGWDRRNPYYHGMIESLARHYRFDIETPFEDLPKNIRQVVLFGSGDEVIKFSYSMGSGGQAGTKRSSRHPFEGVLPNMARRHRETDSAQIGRAHV